MIVSLRHDEKQGVYMISSWQESSIWVLRLRSMPVVLLMYSSKQCLNIQREKVSSVDQRKPLKYLNNTCVNEDISQTSSVKKLCASSHLSHKEETDGGFRCGH